MRNKIYLIIPESYYIFREIEYDLIFGGNKVLFIIDIGSDKYNRFEVLFREYFDVLYREIFHIFPIIDKFNIKLFMFFSELFNEDLC